MLHGSGSLSLTDDNVSDLEDTVSGNPENATPVGLEPTTFESPLKCLTRSPMRYPLRHGAG